MQKNSKKCLTRVPAVSELLQVIYLGLAFPWVALSGIEGREKQKNRFVILSVSDLHRRKIMRDNA